MTTNKRPLFFFSAGEPSGDIHAAQLILELKKRFPDAQFVGYGGPEMAKAGCNNILLTQLAVMWFGRVLWNIRTFLKHIKNAEIYFRNEHPDAVILVDFPGFNWLIAKKARNANIPVYYFMPPQIWGWGQWRIKKMRRLINHILCCLPFEEKWFNERDCQAYRIGHPFFEEVRKKKLDQQFIDSLINSKSEPNVFLTKNSKNNLNLSQQTEKIFQKTENSFQKVEDDSQQNEFFAQEKETSSQKTENSLIETKNSSQFDKSSQNEDFRPILTILPGSRNQEVSANINEMLNAVEKTMIAVPNLRPMIAAFKETQAEQIRYELTKRCLSIPVFVGRTSELMNAATCCLAVSGSVSMELLAHKKPAIIYYRVSRLGFFIQRFFRRVKYITLVNLLAVDHFYHASLFYEKKVHFIPAELSEQEKEMAMFPEFLTSKDKSDQVARQLIIWLTDSESRQKKVDQLNKLLQMVDQEGSPIENAGQYIEKTLKNRPS